MIVYEIVSIVEALIAQDQVQVRGINSSQDCVLVEALIAQDFVQARGIDNLQDCVLVEALIAQTCPSKRH